MTADDIRFTDITFSTSTAIALIASATGGTNTLIERIDCSNIPSGGECAASTNLSSPMFIFDNNWHEQLGIRLHRHCAARPRHRRQHAQQLHWIRPRLPHAGWSEQRELPATQEYIAENTITPNVACTGGDCGITIRGDNTNWVIANNYVTTVITVNPQFVGALEHVQQGLIEEHVRVPVRFDEHCCKARVH